MKIKKVNIPIYGGTLNIVQVDDWIEIKAKYKKDFSGCLGAFFQVEGLNNHYFVAFEGVPPTRTIVHESVHVCSSVFAWVGIEKDVRNDEAEAYFTDWIYNEIEVVMYG